MKIPLRTFIISLLLSFTAGFITSLLIFGCNKTSSLKAYDAAFKVKELKKQAGVIEVSYQKQIDALQDQNIELQQELEVSEGLLIQAKQEVQVREVKIQKIIQSQRSKSKKDHFKEDLFRPVFPSNDLAGNQPNCDSLINEVAGYIQANHRKDSVYELQLLHFDTLLSNKDRVIETSAKAYDDLKGLFDQSLVSQNLFQRENKSLLVTNKRQKFKSKVLSAGFLVLSGFTANYMLRH